MANRVKIVTPDPFWLRSLTLKSYSQFIDAAVVSRAGAYLVSDLPDGLTAIECPKCGRYGRYRKETLLQRFGPDMPLPHVLNLLANCPKQQEWGDPCQVVYADPPSS